MSLKTKYYNTWPLKKKMLCSTSFPFYCFLNDINIENQIYNLMKKFSIRKSICFLNKGITEKSATYLSLDFNEFYNLNSIEKRMLPSIDLDIRQSIIKTLFHCYNKNENSSKLNQSDEKNSRKPTILAIDIPNEYHIKIYGLTDFGTFKVNTNCIILNEEFQISSTSYKALLTINNNDFKVNEKSYINIKENKPIISSDKYFTRNDSIACIMKHIINTPISFRTKENFIDQFDKLLKAHKINKKNMMNRIFTAQNIDEQIQIFTEETLLSYEDIENRESLIKLIEILLNQYKVKCKLAIFGSNDSNFGSVDSSIDVYISNLNIDSNYKMNSSNEKLKLLEAIKEIFETKFEFRIENPIVETTLSNIKLKTDFSLIDRKYQKDGINVIFNMPEIEYLQSSKIMTAFCKFDKRFRTLLSILLYWGKISNLIGDGKIAKFAFIQMIIFYCQRLTEPILPSIEIILPEKDSLNTKNIGLLLTKWKAEQSHSNNISTFELLKMFFTFYANFDFRMEVICPKTGESKMKDKWVAEDQIVKSKVEGYKKSIKIRKHINGKCEVHEFKSFCCIEHPLKLGFNLTAKTDQSCIKNFIYRVRNVSKYSNNIFKKERNTKYFWGIANLICD